MPGFAREPPPWRLPVNSQGFFEEKQWRFCIIAESPSSAGGAALHSRCYVTLLSGYGSEEEFISAILASPFRARIAGAADFAVRNRVLLLSSPDGVPIDVSLGSLPFEEACVDRASPFEFEPGCALRTCSAEDLVVLKLFAGRDRDWVDVKSVVDRSSAQIDWPYMEAQLQPLADLKEDPTILANLERLKRRAAKPLTPPLH